MKIVYDLKDIADSRPACLFCTTIRPADQYHEVHADLIRRCRQESEICIVRAQPIGSRKSWIDFLAYDFTEQRSRLDVDPTSCVPFFEGLDCVDYLWLATNQRDAEAVNENETPVYKN